jgi:hypothetical protein
VKGFLKHVIDCKRTTLTREHTENEKHYIHLLLPPYEITVMYVVLIPVLSNYTYAGGLIKKAIEGARYREPKESRTNRDKYNHSCCHLIPI